LQRIYFEEIMMYSPQSVLEVQGRKIGENYPTYFIADIAANHDGDLERSKDLIYLAAEAGADAAKFQHFQAATIVSDHGFKSLKSKQSHQAKWNDSVFDVYKAASVNLNWTETLKETCQKAGIPFFTFSSAASARRRRCFSSSSFSSVHSTVALF
jgi:N-acetylneuraminate synthase